MIDPLVIALTDSANAMRQAESVIATLKNYADSDEHRKTAEFTLQLLTNYAAKLEGIIVGLRAGLASK